MAEIKRVSITLEPYYADPERMARVRTEVRVYGEDAVYLDQIIDNDYMASRFDQIMDEAKATLRRALSK